MRNRITTDCSSPSITIGQLEIGQMFHHVNTQAETNIYMKTDTMRNVSDVTCIYLTTGQTYSYPYNKVVMPIRNGQSVTIQQGC